MSDATNVRHWIRLVEAKSAPLYHATGFYAAVQILERGNLEASENSFERDSFYNVSTTRDPRLRYYQIEGDDRPGQAPIQFVLSQQRIAYHHKMSSSHFGLNDEQEEKVHTTELPISNVSAIQFFSVPHDFVPNEYDEEYLKDMGGRNAAYKHIAYLARDNGIAIIDLRRRMPRTIARHIVRNR